MKRLEAAVGRLEAISAGGFGNGSRSLDICTELDSDPAIRAFEDMKSECVGRVLTAAETIGGEVLEVSKIVDEAFKVQKELLIQIKKSQVVDFSRVSVLSSFLFSKEKKRKRILFAKQFGVWYVKID